jgi:hypothetical protein
LRQAGYIKQPTTYHSNHEKDLLQIREVFRKITPEERKEILDYTYYRYRRSIERDDESDLKSSHSVASGE